MNSCLTFEAYLSFTLSPLPLCCSRILAAFFKPDYPHGERQNSSLQAQVSRRRISALGIAKPLANCKCSFNLGIAVKMSPQGQARY